jgi:hypothetical protein
LETIGKAVVFTVLFVALFGLLVAWPTELLWNWLMPVVFGLPRIGFLQAWGLIALAGVFFKSSTTRTSK